MLLMQTSSKARLHQLCYFCHGNVRKNCTCQKFGDAHAYQKQICLMDHLFAPMGWPIWPFCSICLANVADLPILTEKFVKVVQCGRQILTIWPICLAHLADLLNLPEYLVNLARKIAQLGCSIFPDNLANLPGQFGKCGQPICQICPIWVANCDNVVKFGKCGGIWPSKTPDPRIDAIHFLRNRTNL